MLDVGRREFIILLGGAAVWPLAARAQQAGRTYRLAFLNTNPREAPQNIALLDELRRHGFVEGQNLTVRGFNLRIEQFRNIAAESVKQGGRCHFMRRRTCNSCSTRGHPHHSDSGCN
jgi:hypothetical protein